MGIFGWSLPPGVTTLPGEEDEPRDNSLVEQAFADYDGLGTMYRTYYKYTDCGPSVGALVREWVDDPHEEPIIEWRGDEPVQTGTTTVSGSREVEKWHYCDALYKLGTWEDMRKKGQLIVALCVASIVEGVDEGTDTITLQCCDLEGPEAFKKAWDEAVDATNSEACAIWNATHGCPTCAKHWLDACSKDTTDWKGDDDDRWQVGETSIWADCPDCEGDGVVI